MAQQLVSAKVRTRTRLQGEAKCRLTFEELQQFADKLRELPCHIVEAPAIYRLLEQVRFAFHLLYFVEFLVVPSFTELSSSLTGGRVPGRGQAAAGTGRGPAAFDSAAAGAAGVSGTRRRLRHPPARDRPPQTGFYRVYRVFRAPQPVSRRLRTRLSFREPFFFLQSSSLF